MNVLIVGNGAREHALAWKIKQSKLCKKLFVAPGNPGIQSIAECLPWVEIDNFESIKNVCIQNHVNLLLVGQELPLVKGIRNFLHDHNELQNLMIIGPDKNGALLEGSKDFSKSFMLKYGIPTAPAKTFTASQITEAKDYVNTLSIPIVIKADGLAAGKGVIIANSHDEAYTIIDDILKKKKFGDAGNKILIEKFLKGVELSVFILTDGTGNYILLPEAKDYKRIGENDTGLNTGGMGAISPVPFADEVFMEKVKQKIIIPTLEGLKNEQINYIGFIFIGIMNVNHDPYVIEYNVRLGDPETEAIVTRIESDLLEYLVGAAKGNLNKLPSLKISNQYAATVFLVSGGYPEHFEKGFEILGLENVKNCLIFHAGTAIVNNKLVNTGGRVLALTSNGKTLKEALSLTLENAQKIYWEKYYYRKDIGLDLLNYIHA